MIWVMFVPATLGWLAGGPVMSEALSLALFLVPQEDRARPPVQPESGPGGAEYHHDRVRSRRSGWGGETYWIFEPRSPKPKSAPVIVFLHAWGVMHPGLYRAWIDHLVQRGNIVIYPRYQCSLVTLPGEFTPNALHAVKAGLKELSRRGQVRPDLDRFAWVGHSAGGVTAANLAAMAAQEGLPHPRALMVIEPGLTVAGFDIIPREDHSGIPADTLMLVLVGEHDLVVGEETGRLIYEGATAVRQKNLAIMKSDFHGRPGLLADHLAPLAGRWVFRPDALEYFGFWKLFDGLCEGAFYSRNLEYALGDTREQRFMGIWSDGRPVRGLHIDKCLSQ